MSDDRGLENAVWTGAVTIPTDSKPAVSLLQVVYFLTSFVIQLAYVSAQSRKKST